MAWKFELPGTGFLDAIQKRQVQRLQSRLVLSDSERGIPGATEAMAEEFVDKLLQMSGTVYYEIPVWRVLYKDGLAALDKASQDNFGTPLVDLSDEHCDSLLTDLEGGNLAGMPDNIDQGRLFKTLWRHTIQGCFADPRWGGNKDKVMWQWYGYLQDIDTGRTS